MAEGNEGPGCGGRLGGSFRLVHSLCWGRDNWALNLILADGHRHIVSHILTRGPGLYVAVVHLQVFD